MKNRILFSATLVLVAMALVACNKGDDGLNPAQSVNYAPADLIGTWKAVHGVEIENGQVTREWAITDFDTRILTFEEGGDYAFAIYNPDVAEPERGTGLWTLEGNLLEITEAGRDHDNVFIIAELTSDRLVTIEQWSIYNSNQPPRFYDIRLTYIRQPSPEATY